MAELHYATLPDRRLIEAGGSDAHHFLQNLITNDLEDVDKTGAGAGALLTPQGKILFDFLIYKVGTAYLLDTPAATAGDFLKRLTFYRLRAKVDLTLLPEDQGVAALWGGSVSLSLPVETRTDPRLAGLGYRLTGSLKALQDAAEELGAQASTLAGYHAHRIALGVPEGLQDFTYSDIFPHDAVFDQLGSVSFTKGCYVGQEVVSRMEHRSTARKRFVKVASATPLPGKDTDIQAGGKSIGSLGSCSSGTDGTHGLALIRLDKAAIAINAGEAITCSGAAIELSIPGWANFTWPESSGGTGA